MTEAKTTLGQVAAMLSPPSLVLGTMSVFFLAVATLLENYGPRLFLYSGAAAFLLLAALVSLLSCRASLRAEVTADILRALTQDEEAASFVTGRDGVIGFQNAAAIQQFGVGDGVRVAEALRGSFADPSRMLTGLLAQADSYGKAEERVVAGASELHLDVRRIDEAHFLWRLERTQALQDDPSPVPRALIAKGGAIEAMNPALSRALGCEVSHVADLAKLRPCLPATRHNASGTHADYLEFERDDGYCELIALPRRAVAGRRDGDTAFEALPVPILQITPDGTVCRANRLARHLLEVDDASEMPMSDLVEGLGRPVADWLADAFEGRGLRRPEVVRASRPKTDLFLQITLGQISSKGAPRLVAVLHDATELKTLEAQFVQSQKMQAIGQLAGGVAHDFNNLLTAISGHCDLLLLRHDEGDPEFSDLEQINQNANRAASLVGQLLAFSRKQNLRLELLDMRATLSDLTHLLDRLVGERVSLTYDHDPSLSMVRADKRQLEQVLMNLVVNARDAMPNGGNICIETRRHHLGQPLRRDRVEVPAGDYVLVRVTDEGTGIPPDKLPKIFEPFFTTKRTGEGTGLGLSTAYGIVKQTGGYIFADSVPGKGAEFVLYFPAHEAAEARILAPAEAKPRLMAPSGDGVVLLVEDEAPVRAFASRALRMRGFTVIEAEDGETALQTLTDASLHVDIFVTDVIMPGMDGPTWVTEALKARPDTKVVFMSGYAEENFPSDQARIPNSVFLPKPFSLTALTSTVNEQLA